MARCLNMHAGAGHENPPGAVRCRYCDFLVEGASVGNYEVLSFIGSGSYGHVYKVREPNPLGRILALKVLRHDQFNTKAQANFFQEARRIANMQHPNILPVYNFGQIAESQQPYFVMEYAPQTISDLFRTSDGGRRLAFVEELVPYVEQTASALKYVHDNGLVHQDIKPGNLLIGRNKQILLADFGTTYYLGMQTHASLGEITGTAAYMPPEQWQGNPRRDSDQYALAFCCYELLCGRPPFTYKGLEDMWKAHLHEAPTPAQTWNPRVPVEVWAVLQRAMAKDYRQRYSSIIEFAEHYEEAVRIAQQRYICQDCGQQNRTGARRCAFCGAQYDNRYCPYCDAPIRFGQRCCPSCGRLVASGAALLHSPLVGVSVRQGRYTIKRVIKQSEETGVMTAVASDGTANDRLVFLKRWECADAPLAQRARDVAYYEQATEPLARLRHPLVPAVLDRFAEGRHYYAVMSYIDGESLQERLLKLLRPLPEHDILGYMNNVLNILAALERSNPPLRPYDISPANILIERQRGRVFLTGLQIPPPPPASVQGTGRSRRTTRRLMVSPYLPIRDKPHDQRTCIYALAATMFHALTNVAPPHYPAYPPLRLLNSSISTGLETVLGRALLEDSSARYQTYATMQRDIQQLLAR